MVEFFFNCLEIIGANLASLSRFSSVKRIKFVIDEDIFIISKRTFYRNVLFNVFYVVTLIYVILGYT